MKQPHFIMSLAAGCGLLASTASLGPCALGCKSSESGDRAVAPGGAAGAGGAPIGNSGASGGTAGMLLDSGTSGSGSGQGGRAGDAQVCAAQTATGEIQPVYLSFAFDVSGSMGELDYPWHDPVLKWEPVVAASESFFVDPASAGITASLEFFPTQEDRCNPAMYVDPDVPMTSLPSSAFEAAITALTPQTQSDWRGGTPTLAVLQGTYQFLEEIMGDAPDALYAVVLVTDGYPQGCDDNDISSVVNEVSSRSATVLTYVIGVANPPLPDAPDTVTDLHAIAVAGGTSGAFIIETGDPKNTKNMFSQAIDDIRGQSFSCEIVIPPAPAGKVFDRSKVRVLRTSGGDEAAFVYDPDCVEPNAWYYNDPNAPKTIVLCPSTCDSVMSDPKATISVEFGCEDVIDVK